MVKLIIDQGNTLTKVALFEGETMLRQGVLNTLAEISDWAVPASVIILSSVSKPQALLSHLSQQSVLVLDKVTPVPIVKHYATPETLGNDRLAVVVAAATQFPSQNSLVIDVGSCITFDFINANKEYLGGSIAPGVSMRLKAMHQQTARLPLVQPNATTPLIGDSTESALRSGALNGALAEIDGIINRYKEQYPTLKVLLTGGDSAFFDKGLKNSIFADPYLVFKGLNEILDYNEAIT